MDPQATCTKNKLNTNTYIPGRLAANPVWADPY